MQNYKHAIGCLVLLLCMHTAMAQTTKQPAKVKPPATTQRTVSVPAQVVAVQPTNGLHLGRYELYSGIPSIYLGHFILLNTGKYKVAFESDEDNYDVSGSYIFHADTQTIEWKGGMFKSNNWGGKLVKKENGFRIEFNKATFGESAGK
jgi:hypothetical protein